MTHSEQARARAERLFKRKQDEKGEGARATDEYFARERAMREKTARLRALRLTREQAERR